MDDYVTTLTYRGWTFTHDGKWLTMRQGQNSMTVSGLTIERKDLDTFAKGWATAELFLSREG